MSSAPQRTEEPASGMGQYLRWHSQGVSTGDVTVSTWRAFHVSWFGFVSLHLLLSSPAWSVVGIGFLNPSSEGFRWASILALPLCVAAALNPGRHRLALLAMALWAATKIDALPLVPNHITLALLVTVLYGLCLVVGALQGRDPDGAVAAFQTVVPAIRASVVVFYVMSALHKCNDDFFDPGVSCGASMYRELAAVAPILPVGTLFDWAAIIGTFTIELLIPLLLLVPRLRLAGVLLGMPFHIVLAVHPNVYVLSFTVSLFALYLLFLPPGLVSSLDDTVTTMRRRVAAVVTTWLGQRGVRALLAALAVGWVVVASSGWLPGSVPASLRLGVCAALMGVWIAVIRRVLGSPALRSPPQPESAGRSVPLLVVPLLVAGIGLAPYLGVKTTGTFSMFSNLRIEQGATNHWLLPAGLQASGLAGDTVRIVESSDPYLQELAENGDRLPHFELRAYLGERSETDLRVTFVHRGQRESLVLPRDAATVEAEKPHWLAAKLLSFRPIPPPGPNRCQW